ncbi:flagellin [Candidatus Levibacter sp. Uisw_134_01]|uniref:flagellin N-terminal helical domain-containing protein n=1 Tax=Candidatus Levibacter sp. Uisw_134_01 TaxID=3230999 RepID=UPI003D4A5060
MPTVNTNSAATFALNKMNATERDMLTSMERLSSGKRINHAGDDAAGAAISDRMTAQIKGLEQSVRNAGDVISMAQVAEGALDESSDILQRIRELAIQSASDVMNAEERSYLNAEVIQMLAELDRVTRDTTFNEIAVLDGSFADRRFQIGTHEREFAQLSVSSMRIDALGAFKAVSDSTDTTGINSNLALNAYAVADTTETNLIQDETFTVHGILGSSTVTAAAGSTVRDIATSVNAIFDSTGVSAIASSQLKIEAKSLDSSLNGQNSVSFSIQGKNGTSTSISANITLNSSKGSSVLSNLRDSVNNYTTTTGITATLSSDNSSIILVQNEGYDIKLGDVNFASDTVSTGAQRVLLVTSLDNDEGVAGATVSLGDTNVTVTDADSLVSSASGTANTAMTLNGTLASTADDNGLVTTFDASSNGTTAITKDGALAASTTLNSLITITHASDTDSTYTIVGTDIYGNAQTEDIAVTTTDITSGLKVFQTVTSITPSGNGPSNVIIGVAATVTNKSALVTITSGASDESDKTFTVVGTDMDGAALTETITGPTALGTVTGRQIFKTIHSITPTSSTTGAITVGTKAADSVIVTGQLEMVSSNSFTVIGEDGKGLFELSPGAASLDKLEGVNVKTRTASINALRVIDRSLDRIHMERAKLGALSSRMEKAIDNLSNVALNTAASRGRIQDADFAKESAELTKHQILQQSAMAMIAQAGKAQQNVLQLLQN